MDEDLKISDFDILGVIKLKDIKGIEKYVTKIENTDTASSIGEYFSRSREYYNVKTLTELSEEREYLKTLLSRAKSKRDFVILENMLNCSAKVYFKLFEDFISKGKDSEILKDFKIAQECLIEDSGNIVKLLDKKGLINVNSKLVLPKGDKNSPRRAIEMDNKGILYIFAKSLKVNENPENVEILTPGYGSIYIGPFLKQMYGYDFTHMLKSKYIEESCGKIDESSIRKVLSSDRVLDPKKKIVLLDDNVGTGSTMSEIKSELAKENINDVTSGAVQYNWRNYYKVSNGQKQGIERFDVNEFEILSPLNYAVHKLYKHAIDAILSSAEEYEQYLNSKSYRLNECSDIEGTLLRGLICARRTGLELKEEYEIPDDEEEKGFIEIAYKYDDGRNERHIKPQAQEFINTLISNILKLENRTINKNKQNKEIQH